MPTQEIEERREYYRIDDRIALEIIPPTPDRSTDGASPQLFDLLAELHQLDFEAQHLLRQIAEGNRTLANYLKVQNKRIELIGQALAQDLLKEIGPARPVVLSEGGVSFAHDVPVELGTLLTLRLVLLPQALGLTLQARVTHCAALDKGDYQLGTEFEALTDAQRQLLARHILQKQALQRRLARDHQQGS
ncbi:PilZ domain-containing protein [Stutzerimonas stutzeri]|uniref:PilZ domain-containing protein n=1 Tax=Stutzerimonas sp. S1 TaxID=3030652 RepID=UPI00222401F0|nr:PilZ domain-containing protein [Stutzerimonas sp. S1]MCW3150247.1 PilZ domain-containing protein [Stutzerimonas sp. S1]